MAAHRAGSGGLQGGGGQPGPRGDRPAGRVVRVLIVQGEQGITRPEDAAPAFLSWRLVVEEEPRSGPANMALDHALAEELRPDEGVLRFYAWRPATISFGRNEPTRGRYDRSAARREGLEFVRRPTGGRAVLHAAEVTYAVALPVGALGDLRSTYRRVNEGLVGGLRSLGADVGTTSDGVALAPDAGPCFQVPAPGEVTASGRKLVGSAQARVGDAILQHGSIILQGDQSALSRLTGAEVDPEMFPATLEGLIGDTSWHEVATALAEGLRLALGGSWTQGAYHARETETARRLEADRYGTDAWTWRR